MRIKNYLPEKRFVVVCESVLERPFFARKDWWCSPFGICWIDKKPPSDFHYTRREAEQYAEKIRDLFPKWTVEVLRVDSIDHEAMRRRLQTKARIVEAGMRLQAEKPDRVN